MWREICRDILRESRATRLNELLVELLNSLEAMERERLRQLNLVQSGKRIRGAARGGLYEKTS
jgi:hypothetical protein